MLKLIVFEMKKIVNSSFFRILMIVFLLFFLAYYVYVYINTERVEDEIRNLETMIQTFEQFIQEKEIALESAEGAEAANIQSEIDFQREWVAKDKATLELYEQKDWKAILQQEIDQQEPQIGQMRYFNQTHTYTWPTLFTVETYVEMSKWMRDKEVTPLLPINSMSWITLYDQDMNVQGMSEEEALKDLAERSDKYSSTSIHYLHQFFGLLFSIFGAVFFLFLFGDVVTKEGFGRNGSIHLLRTQPVHRDTILASKFLTVILLSTIILLGTVVLSMLTGVIFDGFGDWEYPVLIYGEDRTFTLINLGTFLIKAVGMFMMILLFCYSILFLFSVITRRVLAAIGLTLAVLLIGTRWSGEFVTSSIAHFIPFHYFQVLDVVTNEMAVTMDNYNFSYTNGMVSLGITSLIVLIVTYGISVLQYRNSNS
ncbi:ABC transporter permease [Ornithinibacillus halophilus]|uniref:ABC-type transport system involved in multi-copper enzyme maturation, permease component n=1 Tax=Ornithinibacillus halophilus TaxID=930117 RepID=A0A1M5DWF9_9BACI|nr:ABC transporter permease [Ornithinibacillus halophilus]SHF71172.1 ABC-type transport system involved in multi-copper enzyme maturation, permease component [Ornithinibacillus halophilus]